MSEPSTSARRWPVWPKAWVEYFQFIRDPALPARMEPFGLIAFRRVGELFLLKIVIAAAFLTAFLSAERLGADLPSVDIDRDALTFFFLAVLVAPPLEELVFRSWLTGRRPAMTAAAAPLILIAVFAAASFIVGGLGRTAVIALLAGWRCRLW